MSECPQCGFQLLEQGEECPGCGRRPSPPPQVWETSWSLVYRYFQNVWAILTRPATFFREIPFRKGLTGPLCFALTTHWIGSALGFIWHLMLGGSVHRFFQGLFRSMENGYDVDSPARTAQLSQIRDQILEWFFGVGPVLLDPFFTLVSILVTSLFVFAGARILVAPSKKGHPDEISFESAVRIVCFGMTPSLLNSFPILGGFIASLYTLIVTVIGTKETYRVNTGRALIIALFPKLLFLGILLGGLLSIIMVIVKFMTSFI
jgi:hypothetical protein